MKSAVRLAVVLSALLVVVAFASVASAQGWTPYSFDASERYTFKVVSYEQDGYEDEDWTIPRYVAKESIMELDVVATDQSDENDDPIYNVSLKLTQQMSRSRLVDSAGLDLMVGPAYTNAAVAMNPFMFWMVLPFFEETEWEIGERMSIFGAGRVVLTGEETWGGRKGYVVQLETGEAGQRVVSGVWVIDPELALPIAVRTYDNEGRLQSELLLEAYHRY